MHRLITAFALVHSEKYGNRVLDKTHDIISYFAPASGSTSEQELTPLTLYNVGPSVDQRPL